MTAYRQPQRPYRIVPLDTSGSALVATSSDETFVADSLDDAFAAARAKWSRAAGFRWLGHIEDGCNGTVRA
jgi:hypothetical protein